jgi:hypothetical protein
VLHSSPPEVCKVCSGNRQLLLGICSNVHTYTHTLAQYLGSICADAVVGDWGVEDVLLRWVPTPYDDQTNNANSDSYESYGQPQTEVGELLVGELVWRAWTRRHCVGVSSV